MCAILFNSVLLGGLDPADPAHLSAADQASPVHYVHRNSPPTLLFHGTRDCTVPDAQSQILFAALQQAGVPSELTLIKADHAEAAFFNTPALQEQLLAFLQKHLV